MVGIREDGQVGYDAVGKWVAAPRGRGREGGKWGDRGPCDAFMREGRLLLSRFVRCSGGVCYKREVNVDAGPC